RDREPFGVVPLRLPGRQLRRTPYLSTCRTSRRRFGRRLGNLRERQRGTCEPLEINASSYGNAQTLFAIRIHSAPDASTPYERQAEDTGWVSSSSKLNSSKRTRRHRRARRRAARRAARACVRRAAVRLRDPPAAAPPFEARPQVRRRAELAPPHGRRPAAPR